MPSDAAYEPVRVLVFGGSMRDDSLNGRLASLVARLAGAAGATRRNRRRRS